jgi:hypothetical protein
MAASDLGIQNVFHADDDGVSHVYHFWFQGFW